MIKYSPGGNYPPNETIFLGSELVGGRVGGGVVRSWLGAIVGYMQSWLGAEFVRGRVCKGPRDVPESSQTGLCPKFPHL